MESEPPSYSDEELSFYQELFTLFDHDGSDSVCPTELGNALRCIGCNPVDAEINAMLDEAEDKVNADGKLEFFDFCDIIAKNRKTTDQEEDELNAAFRVFDKNGDGKVRRAELKQVLINVGMNDSELDDVFDAVDLDGNGFIDYRELVRLIMGR